MYVRMTDGRDRGEVKDFNFEDAQAMIRNGQALAVDFGEADPLGKRSHVEMLDAQSQINPKPVTPDVPAKSAEPAVMANKNIPAARAQKPRK